MSIRSLVKYANFQDVKRSVRNPRKAYRVFYRELVGKHRENQLYKRYTLDRRNAFDKLFPNNSDLIDSFQSDLAESDLKERINTCEEEFGEYPFGLGGMLAGGETAYLAARLLEPDGICEIGVANGVSTAYLLAAAKHGGFKPDIRGVDRPKFANEVREQRGKRGLSGLGGVIPDSREAGWVAPRQLREDFCYQYHAGDFNNILPGVLNEMQNPELVLYDASKDSDEMAFAFDAIIEKLTPGGLLISDDISRNSAFEKLIHQYPEYSTIYSGCGMIRKPHQ